MKPLNVLLVTYSFPPAGGVGVLRAASLARHFPGEEIRLDVLTTKNASAVGTDSKLLADIPSSVTIHRTITLDLPFGVKKRLKRLLAGRSSAGEGTGSNSASKPGLLKRIIQDVLLPDPQVTWMPILTRAAKKIIKSRNIDVVVITVPPFSCVLLVAKLRQQFPTLSIVVDFRDEWLLTTINLVSFSRSDRAIRIAHEAEASAVSNSTAIVAVTEAARREIRNRYPQQSESKFQLIPNGFDSTRLPHSVRSNRQQNHDKIVVTYIGSIYGSTDPTTLVTALQSLPPQVKSRFKLNFVGRIEEPRFRDALLQLGDMVELKGFLPQQEALAMMDEADYALLITHDPLNVSAKFYDYVGAGKPILAVVHPAGDARRLLEQLRAGWWADSSDVQGIRQLFIDAAARGDNLGDSFHPDTAGIAQYERRALAKRYAQLLHRIAGRPSDSGSPVDELAREAR